MGTPADHYLRIRDSLPDHVDLVVAAKGRTPEELLDVIGAGARLIGENYVEEAERIRAALPCGTDRNVEFHMIGHLQRNKVNRALSVFRTLQSLDSIRLAEAIDRRLKDDERLDALVQVNVGGEPSKYGLRPEDLGHFLHRAAGLRHIAIRGLMTMEPYCDDPDEARPHFRRMRALFDAASDMNLPGVRMHTLSMGMSHSYAVAVQEGATMVRIGSALFGPRTACG